jgi:NADH:ubiquinone oxidoreductase subunit E
MRQCGKGPNLRFDGKLYHGADAKLLEQLMAELDK